MDFLVNLKKKDINLMTKIAHKIRLLGMGKLGKDDVKYLKNKVYELRIKDLNNISRVFYFNYFGDKIILLDGYVKKDNKIKKSILNRVILYKNNYMKINGNI